jgi:Secretion system C-terminal sorting domain
MQKLFYTTVFSCATYFVGAQTTITNSIFPQAADVLPISTSFDTTIIVTATSPLSQTWDFSQLNSDSYREDIIDAATNGLNFVDFPSSEITQPLISGFGGTAYVDVTATNVVSLGGGLEILGFSLVAPFSDPKTLQTAPLNLATNQSDAFDISFGVNIDSVPFLRQLIDSLAGAQLPIRPDSLRLRQRGRRNMYVDAQGTAIMYDGSYTVLRQKVTETSAIQIEARAPSPFGSGGFWIDVTSFISSAIPIPLTDTVNYYDFLANNYHQPICRLNMNNDNNKVESVEFKGENYTAVARTDKPSTYVELFPNPAQTVINLDFKQTQVSNFRATLSTLQGANIRNYDNLNGNLIQLNVAGLINGAYILTVFDDKNQKIKSQLVKIIAE